MKVKDLKELLQDYPDDATICIFATYDGNWGPEELIQGVAGITLEDNSVVICSDSTMDSFEES